MIASSSFPFHLLFSSCKRSACCRGNGQATAQGRPGHHLSSLASKMYSPRLPQPPAGTTGGEDLMGPCIRGRRGLSPDGAPTSPPSPPCTPGEDTSTKRASPAASPCYQSSMHHHIHSGGRGQPRRNQPPLPGPSLLGAQGSSPENPSDFVTHPSSHGKAKKTGTD